MRFSLASIICLLFVPLVSAFSFHHRAIRLQRESSFFLAMIPPDVSSLAVSGNQSDPLLLELVKTVGQLTLPLFAFQLFNRQIEVTKESTEKQIAATEKQIAANKELTEKQIAATEKQIAANKEST